MSALTPEERRQFVERVLAEREAAGLPRHLEDPDVAARVARLLGPARDNAGPSNKGRRRQSSPTSRHLRKNRGVG